MASGIGPGHIDLVPSSPAAGRPNFQPGSGKSLGILPDRAGPTSWHDGKEYPRTVIRVVDRSAVRMGLGKGKGGSNQ